MKNSNLTNPIILKSEPTFDVLYGYEDEDGETSYEKEFDVPLSILQKELLQDEKRSFRSKDFSFVDTIYERHSTDKVSPRRISSMVLTSQVERCKKTLANLKHMKTIQSVSNQCFAL